MNVCTGDETGLLKHWAGQDVTILGSSDQSRENGIISMDRYSDSSIVSILRKNGVLEKWNFPKNSTPKHLSTVSLPTMDQLMGITSYNDEVRIIYNSQGHITLESDGQITHASTIQGPLSVLQPLHGGYAAAGRENDVKFYDMETQQLQWSAKNVPNDFLRYAIIFIHHF